MIADALGYVVSMVADLLKECIESVLPVKVLPQIDAGRAQAKSIAAIRVKENGPVVKLLPEYDHRVGYGFFIVLHGSTVPVPLGIAPDRTLPDRGRTMACCNPRTRELRRLLTARAGTMYRTRDDRCARTTAFGSDDGRIKTEGRGTTAPEEPMDDGRPLRSDDGRIKIEGRGKTALERQKGDRSLRSLGRRTT
jgi:hypothetical protein